MDVTDKSTSFLPLQLNKPAFCNMDIAIRIGLIVLPILTISLAVLSSLALGGVPFAVSLLASIGADTVATQVITELVALVITVVSLFFLHKNFTQKKEEVLYTEI